MKILRRRAEKRRKEADQPGGDPPCGQVLPGFGRDLGPCVRPFGHPEDVSHVDRFGALWWPKR